MHWFSSIYTALIKIFTSFGIVLIRSWNFLAQFLFHFLHTMHFCGVCRATMTWRCKSVGGKPFDFNGGGGVGRFGKIYPAAPPPRQKKNFMHGSSEEKKIMSGWCSQEKNLTNHRQSNPTCSLANLSIYMQAMLFSSIKLGCLKNWGVHWLNRVFNKQLSYKSFS